MDWKKFFRPTKWKILSFIILVIVTFLGFAKMMFTLLGGSISGALGSMYLLVWPILLLDFSLFTSILGIILNLVYFYLLVCVVAYIINLIRRNNAIN